MAYLIGKIFLELGSICLKVNHGSELSRFREEISEKFEDIELITLSNPGHFHTDHINTLILVKNLNLNLQIWHIPKLKLLI